MLYKSENELEKKALLRGTKNKMHAHNIITLHGYSTKNKIEITLILKMYSEVPATVYLAS